MREQMELCISRVGRGKLTEQVRLIGLAGEALAQLRADYERRPSALVCEAIRRKIHELVDLGVSLEEEGNSTVLVAESAG